MDTKNGITLEITIVAAFMFCPVDSDYKLKMNTEYLESQKTLNALSKDGNAGGDKMKNRRKRRFKRSGFKKKYVNLRGYQVISTL